MTKTTSMMTNRVLRSLIILVAAIITVSFPLYAKNIPPTLTVVATTDNAPFSFKLPNGEATGLYVEFWQLWAKTNNIPLLVKIVEFEEGLELAHQPNIIHAGLFKTEERQQWADFSLPIHSVKTGILFNRKYTNSVKLNQLGYSRVAVQPGSFQERFLESGYPQLELESENSLDKIVDHLLDESTQAFVAEIPAIKNLLARKGLRGALAIADEILMDNKVYALVAKNQSKLLKQINQGIENIPLSQIIDLEKKWLPTEQPFFKDAASFESLSMAERRWLIAHPRLIVGVDKHWSPFDFVNEQGKAAGIASDYIKYFEEKLQVKIKNVYNESWVDTFEQFKNREVDLMSAIIPTKERSSSISFTKPYIKVPTVIVTRKNSFYVQQIDDLKNRKLALVKGFAIVEFIKEKNPDIQIVLTSSIEEGLKLLSDGEVDAYAGSISAINNKIEQNNLSNLKIAAFTPYKLNVAMAVREGMEPLVMILNKMIDSMPEKRRLTIANTWLATRVQEGTSISTVLYWVIPPSLILFLVIFIISRLNYKLKIEIAGRKAIEEELKHLAQHDPLTGLCNGRLFEELSQQNLNLAKRDDHQTAILFVDMDEFKTINDTLGHRVGDRVLIQFARRLVNCVRDSDLVARIGGDEFVLQLGNNCDQIKASEVASKIVKRMAQPFEVDTHQVNIGASIGIAIYPHDGDNVETLLKHADDAMYVAKQQGKGRSRVYSKIKI